MFKFTVIILLLLILLNVCSGCVAVPGVVSAIIPAAEGYSTIKTVSTTKSVIDLTLAASNKKTTNDIVLSEITGKDCKLQNTFERGTICESISNR